jgi:molybdopterin molybdotransferase
MDGYAVRSAECARACRAAGVAAHPRRHLGQPLAAGTVARIFTGAPVPAGADAIVMQEDCEVLEDGRVRIKAQPGPAVDSPRGRGHPAGATVIEAGTRLTPAGLGLAASMGLASLRVARKPRVALFSTGDELVMPGTVAPSTCRRQHLQQQPLLPARPAAAHGLRGDRLGIVPDRREATWPRCARPPARTT